MIGTDNLAQVVVRRRHLVVEVQIVDVAVVGHQGGGKGDVGTGDGQGDGLLVHGVISSWCIQ
ncbi:hypothetical protein D3C80_2162410 [compost metagenome]